MRWVAGIVGMAVLLTACLEATTGIRDDEVDDAGTWTSFSVAGIKSAIEGRVTFSLARADSTFRMGLLTGPPGTSIGIISHRDNALYYVASGSGQLRLASDTLSLAPGTVLFVPGDTEHRIHGIAEELDIVVYLARGLSAPGEPDVMAWTAEDLRAGPSDTNEWRVLVESSTLGAGVYTLPKGGGGDDGLSHGFVEYKLVMAGGGRFDVGDGGIEAAPGEMVLIPDGVPHRFRRVSEDLVVLFVFKR